MPAFERTTTLDPVNTQAIVTLQPAVGYDYTYQAPLQQVPGISIVPAHLNRSTPVFSVEPADPALLYFIFCTSGRVLLSGEDQLTGTNTLLQQHTYCIVQSSVNFTLGLYQQQAATCIVLQVPVSFTLEKMLQPITLLMRLTKPGQLQELKVLLVNTVTHNMQFCLFAMLHNNCNIAYRKIFLENKTAELLIDAAQRLDAALPPVGLQETQLSDVAVLRIKKVMSMLEQTPEMHITIIELARQVGTNESYLKKHFKQVTGKTIYAYLLEQRMLRAKQLMIKGVTDMQEVSRLTGYKRKHHFLEAFKRYFGFVPLSVKTFLLTVSAQIELLLEYELSWLMAA